MRTFVWILLSTVLSVQMGYAIAEEVAPAVAPDTDSKVTPRLGGQVGAAGDSAAAEEPPKAELREPENYKSGEKEPFEMGDNVEIKVEGKHGIDIADSKATGVWLILDDVIMKSMGNPVAKEDDVGNLILSFRLSRQPGDSDSRNEWKKLLEKQREFLMTLPISLDTGTSAALPVTTTSGGLKFRITTKKKVYFTLGIGIVLFVLLYLWLIRSGSALRDKPQGPYSLGKSQMAFWGLLVSLTFLGIWINTGMTEHIPDQVLILLGISGSTSLAALLIMDGKDTKKTSVGFFQDICSDGSGMSFHRFQTVIWTVILGVIFISDVMHGISMPEFDPSLLTLMGISNGIYLGFKFPEKNRP